MNLWQIEDLYKDADARDKKATIAEGLSRSQLRFREKLKARGLEVPTSIPELDKEFNIDDVKPTETETTVREAVKGAAQGYLFDTTENILTSVEDYRPDVIPDDMLVFNIPGLKNYDEKKPFIDIISREEFNKMKEKKQISYLPQMMNEGSATFEFTRTMGKVIQSLQMGGVVTKPFTSVMPQALGVQKGLEIIAPGAVASQLAFMPYEERFSNMMTEVVQDTPFDLTQPFFEWLQADDNNNIAEERFKMALESIVLDAAFGTVFKLYKARRDIMKGILNKKAPEELAEIETQAVARINDTKHTKKELPSSEKGLKPSAQVLNAKPDNQDVFTSAEAAEGLIDTLVNGNLKEVEPGSAYKVFNTKFLEDTEASDVVGLISKMLKPEMTQRYKDIPKGPKTLKELEEKGIKLQDTLQGQSIVNNLDDIASQMGMDRDLLLENMTKNFDESIADLDIKVLAYRGAIGQYGTELAQIAKAIVNNPDGMANKLLRARFIKTFERAKDAEVLFGETKRIIARSTTVQRIPFKTKPATAEEMQALDDVLKAYKLDTDGMQILAKSIETAKGPLQSLRIAELGSETLAKRGGRAMIEFYRGLLLASAKTHVTNIVSGTIETLVTPATRYAGSIWTGDKEVQKEVGRHIAGLGYGFLESGRMMLKSMLKEQNILDPMGTKLDGLISPHGNAIAMKKLNPNKGEWHPVNWVSQAVNYTGKLARGSMRILGGEDEFFKQWNYRAQAYAKITKDLPEFSSRKQRKAFIDKEMDKYFDELGRGTNDSMMEYAKKVTFTEELRPGSWAAGLHKLAVKNPPVQLFFPFVRTPANIFTRAFQRTPIFNRLSKTHREMMESSDPAIRAQAAGNTALGVVLYGGALSFVMSGRVTGPGPLDPDRNKVWRQAGNQPYSIRTNDDNWVSYNRLDPTFLPLVILTSAVENADTYAEVDDSFAKTASLAVMGFIRAVSDRTYLQGLQTMLETVTMWTSGNADRMWEPAQNLASNLIPGVISQFDGDDAFHEALSFQERLMRRAPGVTGYNAPKHSWLTGEAIVTPLGYNTGIPVEQGSPNPYLMEIVRMGRSISPPNTYIGNVPLTGPQYAKLNKLIGNTEIGGRTLLQSLGQLMESPQYDFNPGRKYNPDYDDFRVKAVKDVIRGYKGAAQKLLLAQDQSLLQQVMEDRMNAISVGTGGQQLFELNQR